MLQDEDYSTQAGDKDDERSATASESEDADDEEEEDSQTCAAAKKKPAKPPVISKKTLITQRTAVKPTLATPTAPPPRAGLMPRRRPQPWSATPAPKLPSR